MRSFLIFYSCKFSSSSLSWYETLTTNVEPWKSLTTRHNSYFIFLRLLGKFKPVYIK
jgi:hypothetical protein